tara:strand:+ start:123 stop:932 length:810 start_codon:yes stop_codon:yes gene_type:complete
MNPEEEKLLRYNIRHLIKHVKSKKLNEEKKFRGLLTKLMEHELKEMLTEADTPDVEPTPNKSTGINVLGELLKKIIPVLEIDFKSLTTSSEQRESFRAHIANAVVNLLTPAELNQGAAEKSEPESTELQEIDLDIVEDVDIDLDTLDSDEDKFIDIRTDAEKKAEEEPEEEADPRDEFGAGLEGDETGRNMAYQSFKKIESNILDSYELLSNPEDQELFYDYLLANLKLYFDKFEDELDPAAEEPTNQAYQQAVDDQPGAEEDSIDLEI